VFTSYRALLRSAWLNQGAAAYLQGHSARDPLVSPLLADLAGLPPTLIQAASEEILRDDSRRRLTEARSSDGVSVTHREFPYMWHDFQLYAGLGGARRTVDSCLGGGRRVGDDGAAGPGSAAPPLCGWAMCGPMQRSETYSGIDGIVTPKLAAAFAVEFSRLRDKGCGLVEEGQESITSSARNSSDGRSVRPIDCAASRGRDSRRSRPPRNIAGIGDGQCRFIPPSALDAEASPAAAAASYHLRACPASFGTPSPSR